MYMKFVAGSDFVANSVLAFFMVWALCLSCLAHPAPGPMPPCNSTASLEPVRNVVVFQQEVSWTLLASAAGPLKFRVSLACWLSSCMPSILHCNSKTATGHLDQTPSCTGSALQLLSFPEDGSARRRQW